MKHPENPDGIEDVLTLSDAKRLEESAKIGIPRHCVYGPRPKTGGKPEDESDWTLDHRYYFEAVRIPWPLPQDWVSGAHNNSVLRRDGLYIREFEMLLYLDRMFPPPCNQAADGIVEFVDVNPTISRLMTTHVEEDTFYLKDKSLPPPGNPSGGRGPWHLKMPTLVGSGRLVVRHFEPDTGRSVCRVAEVWEEFRAIGWGLEEWRNDCPDQLKEWSQKQLILASNMAGNAYSFFHYGPTLAATLAVYAHYNSYSGFDSASENEPDAGDVESSGSYDDSSSDDL